jgi:hypothetical protein
MKSCLSKSCLMRLKEGPRRSQGADSPTYRCAIHTKAKACRKIIVRLFLSLNTGPVSKHQTTMGFVDR